MRAILIDKFVQNYDEIKISEVPRPRPKEGEVLVKIAAAGVNFVDLLYARGKHQNNRSLVKPPFILDLEFVASYLPFLSRRSRFRRSARLLRKPYLRWDFALAAGLAATAPVSYGALVIRAGLKEGETILIHAAAGALGLMAVQIAKATGCKVIATAGSAEKIDIARKFGADECVNYIDDKEWWKRVLELTDGKGVDVVYDPVGLVDKSLKCLKQKGRILVIGFAGTEGNIEKIAVNRILLRQAQIIGYRFGMTDRIDPSETAKIWEGLRDMWTKRLLRPTVYHKEYRGLESAVTAMKDLAARGVWGKAVIRVQGEERPKL